MNKDPAIEFYRGNAVHAVLKRYEFLDDEKRIIQAAILTSRKDNPNMKFIDEADAILREVSKNNDPIDQDIISTEDAVAVKLAAASIDAHRKRRTARSNFSFNNDMLLYFVGISIFGIIILFVTRPYGLSEDDSRKTKLYTFEEAKSHCQTQGKVLPLTIADAPKYLEIPNELNQDGYWSANGGIIYNLLGMYADKTDGKRHYVVCVDKNGKGIIKY